jgi:hypothetical protein
LEICEEGAKRLGGLGETGCKFVELAVMMIKDIGWVEGICCIILKHFWNNLIIL